MTLHVFEIRTHRAGIDFVNVGHLSKFFGVRAVMEAQPRAFLFENVEGLLHARHADYVATLLRKLAHADYQTEIHRNNTRDYAVPQDRSRIMIVGFRKNLPGVFRMPPKFRELANRGDVVADLMSANGWSGVGKWVQMMRPDFDRFGKPIGFVTSPLPGNGRQLFCTEVRHRGMPFVNRSLKTRLRYLIVLVRCGLGVQGVAYRSF
ncbi:DNA cytosine methyltransferase [Rhizobium tubonense]|uniref:Uncharacterized protein n=1 Tax=Rhizobium tubonense TaxID=484088 RepID=A0A2W4C497_9HYPH|nr:DNA cytosine methyltransferase [Rhizobium tubonense]PZM08337.1 hypothetical protein CPY51_29400 [Rhizobium tubonense]